MRDRFERAKRFVIIVLVANPSLTELDVSRLVAPKRAKGTQVAQRRLWKRHTAARPT